MQVFKFGGASIKNAEAVRNVAKIISREQKGQLLVVVSAMGKTTNALEAILDASYRKTYQKLLRELRLFHYEIVSELFPPASSPLFELLETIFEDLNQRLKAINPSGNYGKNYDSIVGFGERISSAILSFYLNEVGIPTALLHANEFIVTDSNWQEARVDWAKTKEKIIALKTANSNPKQVWLTQGFLGGTENNEIATLGREGSDYSASIFASCLKASSVTIWKDVNGVLNADPKRVQKTELLEQISYQDAAEMTYYGASVIHPKTIKPLANQSIPLFVRSFVNPKAEGTQIGNFPNITPRPSIIFKSDQSLLKFEAKDLSNINQRALAKIIDTLSDSSIRINLMMNTAVSFSICTNTQQQKFDKVVGLLESEFVISIQDNLELVTLKNYAPETIEEFYKSEKALIELKTPTNFQFVNEG